MGLFWDLGQEKLIAEHAKRVGNLESRVAELEHELAQVRQALAETLKRLESKISEDIDRDSRIG